MFCFSGSETESEAPMSMSDNEISDKKPIRAADDDTAKSQSLNNNTNSLENDKKKNGSVSNEVVPIPTVKKSRFSGLGRIFKPWKWKRRRKSEKYEKTAVDLERKISIRSSREELIRRGVLKEAPIKEDGGTQTDSDVTTVEQHETPDEKTVSEEVKDNSTNAEKQQQASNGDTVTKETDNQDVVTTETDKEKDDLGAMRVTAEVDISVKCNGETPVSVEQIAVEYQKDPAVIESAPPSAKTVVMESKRVTIDMTDRGTITPMYQPQHTETSNVSFNVSGMSVPSPNVSFNVTGTAPAIEEYDNVHRNQNLSKISTPGPVTHTDIEAPSSESGLSYHEVPAREPDLSKKPARSALKGNRPVVTVRAKPLPKPRAVKVPMVNSIEEDNKENESPHSRVQEGLGDYDNLPGSDSSDDDSIQYSDKDPGSLAAKVARKDSLARLLSQRPDRNELVEKNIIPGKSEHQIHKEREAIGTKLTRRLSLRPTLEELANRNILHNQSDDEHKRDMEEKKRVLVRKLSFRPTVDELKERKIIRFHDYVEVTEAHEYDRKADKPWTRLTPRDKAAIRKELNEFKSQEMNVHEESKKFTRFHRP